MVLNCDKMTDLKGKPLVLLAPGLCCTRLEEKQSFCFTYIAHRMQNFMFFEIYFNFLHLVTFI